jgi:hypothetical protein
MYVVRVRLIVPDGYVCAAVQVALSKQCASLQCQSGDGNDV